MAFVGRSPVHSTPLGPRGSFDFSPTPLKVATTPTTAPQDAMVASQQAHIDELVQRNRSLEHDIRRLKQSLLDEKEKCAEVVSKNRAVALQERDEAREGCESLLACHRIVHLRTLNELDKERISLCYEREENRKDRLGILQRDYKLTLFQARETDLEAQIFDRDEMIEELKEKVADAEDAYTSLVSSVQDKMSTTILDCQAARSRLKEVEAELVSTQVEIKTLRKENVSAKSSSESSATKVERLALQLDGAKTNIAELESANAELKRTNTDLKRQMTKWQNLETKGDAEVEEMRKRRIEVEVEAKQLEERVAELEQELEVTLQTKVKAIEKEKARVAKLRDENDRMAEVAEGAQAIAKKAHDDYSDLEKQLLEARDLIERLQSGGSTKGQSTIISNDVENSLDENEPQPRATLATKEKEKASEKQASGRPKPKPAYRNAKQPKKNLASDDEVERSNDEAETDGDGGNRKRAQGRAAPKAQSRGQDESRTAPKKRKDISPIDSEGDDSTRTKGKGKSKGKAAAAQTSDEEVDYDEVPKPKAKSAKAKAKAKAAEESDVDDPPPKKQKGKTATTSPTKARKPTASQESRNKAVESTEEVEAQPRKKKKKLFGSTQDSFPWDSLPKGDGTLGIPTDLSPVKETQAVPSRSMFGRMGSAFGLR